MENLILHVMGVYQGKSGYSLHTIQFQQALAGKVTTLATDRLLWTPQDRQIVLDQLWNYHRQGANVVNIAVSPMTFAIALPPYPGWKVSFSVWESTKLESEWLQAAPLAHRYWTATQWNRQVYVDNGLPADKIDVVPEGVDPALFNPHGPRFPQLDADPRFKFLSVGKFEDRKNSAAMIRAFDEEFHQQEDVMLLLLADNQFVADFDLNKELERLNLKNPRNIGAGRWVPTADTLAAIYRSCNAFLAPTRAEGWGLPIGEAMACGLPTIVTHYSGPSEFTNGDNALLLDYKLIPIPRDGFVKANDPGVWAEPDMDQFRRLMRWVYNHRQQAAAIGQRAALEMTRDWTWEKAADKALALIRHHFPKQLAQQPLDTYWRLP
ncbi:MAG: glycosyltransferase family 4 protein [Magnetococcales bacterium]|nr:glycosyltransferase family 4 protein [Magnetococcales bacterium]NGZ25532.1 glycosyltransferase family 4 protein [Magnetococcales bacterium]